MCSSESTATIPRGRNTVRKQVGRYQWRGPPPSPCQVLLYPSGIVTPKYKAELLIPMPKNRMRKIKKTEKQNAQRKKYAKKQDTEREDKPWHPLGKREGFPRGPSGKEPVCQRRRPKSCRFDPWVWKIPWRSAWQHHSHTVDWEIPWPEEPGGLQSVGSQSRTRPKRFSMHFMHAGKRGYDKDTECLRKEGIHRGEKRAEVGMGDHQHFKNLKMVKYMCVYVCMYVCVYVYVYISKEPAQTGSKLCPYILSTKDFRAKLLSS